MSVRSSREFVAFTLVLIRPAHIRVGVKLATSGTILVTIALVGKG